MYFHDTAGEYCKIHVVVGSLCIENLNYNSIWVYNSVIVERPSKRLRSVEYLLVRDDSPENSVAKSFLIRIRIRVRGDGENMRSYSHHNFLLRQQKTSLKVKPYQESHGSKWVHFLFLPTSHVVPRSLQVPLLLLFFFFFFLSLLAGNGQHLQSCLKKPVAINW